MKKGNKFQQININSWNKRTNIHIKSDFYNVKDFISNPNSLKDIEKGMLKDIKNKKILHLQCHFGQDSISLSKLGAKVTAVDFSDEAIKHARKLAKMTDSNVNFIKQDVLRLDIDEEFDIIFSSYGVIGWIEDLHKWGSVIHKHLKHKGEFMLTEFHPFYDLIKSSSKFDYFFKKEPDIHKQIGSYTDGDNNIEIKSCWWNHALSEIFSALENNKLILTTFEEYDYSPYKLENMIENYPGKYVLKDKKNVKLPYIYNLKAIKK